MLNGLPMFKKLLRQLTVYLIQQWWRTLAKSTSCYSSSSYLVFPISCLDQYLCVDILGKYMPCQATNVIFFLANQKCFGRSSHLNKPRGVFPNYESIPRQSMANIGFICDLESFVFVIFGNFSCYFWLCFVQPAYLEQRIIIYLFFSLIIFQ